MEFRMFVSNLFKCRNFHQDTLVDSQNDQKLYLLNKKLMTRSLE